MDFKIQERKEQESDAMTPSQEKLRIIILAICCIAFFILFIPKAQSEKEHSEAEQATTLYLEQFENRITTTEVYNDIAELRKKREELAFAQQNKTLAQRFSDSVVLGDSLTEGLYAYGALYAFNCFGERGARTDTMPEAFDTVQRVMPQHIFLAYGMNDLEFWGGKADVFIAQYKESIDELRQIAPQATLYINGLVPTSDAMIEAKPVFAKWQEYNEALQAFCAQEGIVYIDNLAILESLGEEKYSKDGIHPRSAYYKLWAQHMAEVAGI